MLGAVEAAVQPGFSGPVLDVGGALALAQAQGVDAGIAAALLRAAAHGIMNGTADRRTEGKDGSS